MPAEFHVNMTMFFDPKKVLAAAEKANYRNLSRAGAFVRQRAMHSIRKGKGTSAPGNPPISHSGDLRRGILFGYNAGNKTVVVGPRRYNMVTHADASLLDRVTIPELLEFGGRAAIVEQAFRAGSGDIVWVRKDLRRRGSIAAVAALRAAHRRSGASAGSTKVVELDRVRTRTITVAARPYMHPAMVEELPKFPALWANSVK